MQMHESRTGENVRKALSQELELSSLYRLYAKKAKAEGYLQIADLLNSTADNELEHAGLLFEIRHQCQIPTTQENLDDAVQREKAAPYKQFADEAEKDGFPGTGELCRQLSAVEENHARRFTILSENLRTGDVFRKQQECYWVCRICGGLQYGKYAPHVCPVCGFPQSCFSLYTEDY